MASKNAHKWISSRATSIQFNVPSGCLPKDFSIQNLNAVLVSAIRALCPENTNLDSAYTTQSICPQFIAHGSQHFAPVCDPHSVISTCSGTDIVCPVHHTTLRGLYREYPAILNISRTGRVALM